MKRKKHFFFLYEDFISGQIIGKADYYGIHD